MTITFGTIKATKTQAQYEADELLNLLELNANFIAEGKTAHLRYTRLQAWKKACTIESNQWDMIAEANGYTTGRAGMQSFVIEALKTSKVDFGEYAV
jgi:hypothetical protein